MSDDGSIVTRHKMAGIASIAFGIPNLLMGILFSFSGIAVAIILGVIAFPMYNDDSNTDNPLGQICVVFLIIMLILLLVAAVLFTIVAIIFALAMAGQSVGEYYAMKEIHFGRSVILIFIGSFIALMVG